MNEKWLNYYFAMPPSQLKFFEANGLSCNALISFAYMSKRSITGDFHNILKLWKAKGSKFMLDSGAFTNFRKPDTVRIEPYIEYLQSFCSCWDEYITLDDLASRENTLKNFNLIRSKGLKPLFVDHLKFSDDGVVNKLWNSESKICVSGWGKVTGQGNGAKEEGKENNFNKLLARGDLAKKVKTKMHILAVSSMKKFIPVADVIDSVDSATWSRACGYGEVVVCIENKIGGINIPICKRYSLPWSKTNKYPMSPEAKIEWNKHISKKWMNTSNNCLSQTFCIVQLQKYLSLLNALRPEELGAAVKREKEARKMAGVKKTFFMDDDFPNVWDGSEEGENEVRSAEPLVLEKSIHDASSLKYVTDLNLIDLHSRIHENWDSITSTIKVEAIKSHGLVHEEMIKRGLDIADMDISDYEIIYKKVMSKSE